MNIKDLKFGGVYKDKDGKEFGARKIYKSLFMGVPDKPIDELEFKYTGKAYRWRGELRFVTNALEVINLRRKDIQGFILLRVE